MKDDIILKIKEKESLEILKIIAIIYLIFLFFLGLIIKYQETVIQSVIIIAFAFVIDAFNSGEMIVTEKGITSRTTGFVKFSKIYRLELKNRVLLLYTREKQKPYRIIFSLSEDYKLIENTYRFIEAKVKRIENENQEHKEYVEKYFL